MTTPGLDPPGNHFSTTTPAIIIGSGIAGCAITRALANAGFKCLLYDCHDAPAGETSAVPCALFRPQETRTEQTTTRYFREAFNRIHTDISPDLQSTPNACLSANFDGVLQLVRDSSRWPDSDYYRALSKAEASEMAATELASDALYFDRAGWLSMSGLCNRWIRQSDDATQGSIEFIGNTDVRTLRKTSDGWQLLDAENCVINESRLVIIASAQVASQLTQTAHLPLQKSRGQLSYFVADTAETQGVPRKVITGRGSVIPAANGFWTGSTHQRNNNSTLPSHHDDQVNLQCAIGLCPSLETALDITTTRSSDSWVGFRYSTPDRLPIVGAAPLADWYWQHYADLRHGRQLQVFPPPRYHDGMFLLTGFGSRGALHSVYAAEILTETITGIHQSPTGCSRAIANLLHPARFIIRQLRRGI